MKLKDAMKEAKKTGKSQKSIEGEPIESVRIGISLRVEQSTLEGFKARAAQLGMPYQTLIHSVLVQYLSGDTVSDRLAAAIEQMERMAEQIKALESTVYKKHG